MEGDSMAALSLSNVVRVEKGALDPLEIAARFTCPNPKFLENERLGFSNFGVPKHIRLYHEKGEFIFFPRGLVRDLFTLNQSLNVVDHTATNPARFAPSRIVLKPYQEPAVSALLRRNQGVLVAPPGSGKTVLGIEAIVKRSQKALVLVHTKDLLEQWYMRFREFTRIEPSVIQEGRFDLHKEVTVGMVQSLNMPLDKSFVDQFGLVLLDEAHHCPAYTFQNLINQFPARYRYGLTATPERRDGLSFILTGVMGPVIYQIRRDDLFDNGEVMKPVVKAVQTNFYMPGVQSYADMIQAITADEGRNECILEFISREAQAGHFCLVLSERIDHVHLLREQFSLRHPQIPSACTTSRSSKKIRDGALEAMNMGEIKVLFATKLADEGLDIPRLDRLFLTCPVRSINKVNQQIGRIMRSFPGKKDAVVFDFRDSLVSLAESQYHTRLKRVYNSFDVVEVPYARAC
jgi:superfamily II DNA or RNA helicase